MTGNGRGDQPVLVRADLLLPSRKRDDADGVQDGVPAQRADLQRHGDRPTRGTGFDGTCRLPDGSARSVTVDWHLVHDSSLVGRIESRGLDD